MIESQELTVSWIAIFFTKFANTRLLLHVHPMQTQPQKFVVQSELIQGLIESMVGTVNE